MDKCATNLIAHFRELLRRECTEFFGRIYGNAQRLVSLPVELVYDAVGTEHALNRLKSAGNLLLGMSGHQGETNQGVVRGNCG